MSNLASGRVILKFNNSVLVQKTLNLYKVYELNNCPHDPTNNFTLKIGWYSQISQKSNKK